MNVHRGWLEKKKRNEFYSLFSEWNKRYATFDGNVFCIYTEPKRYSSISIQDMSSIHVGDDCMFYLVTRFRTYTLRAQNDTERDEWVTLLQTELDKHEMEKRKRIKDATDEINDYVAALRSESLIRHMNPE
jgi:hypothetical protein